VPETAAESVCDPGQSFGGIGSDNNDKHPWTWHDPFLRSLPQSLKMIAYLAQADLSSTEIQYLLRLSPTGVSSTGRRISVATPDGCNKSTARNLGMPEINLGGGIWRGNLKSPQQELKIG
jgi:hypothetical protein